LSFTLRKEPRQLFTKTGGKTKIQLNYQNFIYRLNYKKNSRAELSSSTTGVEEPHHHMGHSEREMGFATPDSPDWGRRGGDDVAITQKKLIIITSMHQVIRVDYAIIAVLVMQDGLVGR
jgi:hypothetical protein